MEISRKYKWRPGGPKPIVEAAVFGEAMEAHGLLIGNRPIVADDIVKIAEDPTSPIHPMFQWDNDKAASEYRKVQARHYLGSLEIVLVRSEAMPAISTKAFHVVEIAKQRGYVPTETIMSERDLRMQVLATAKRELESFLRKYTHVLSLGPAGYTARIQAVVDAIKDEVDQLATDAQKRRPQPTGADDSPRVPAE